VNNGHKLAGQAPTKTTTTVKCAPDATLSEVFQKLFEQYVTKYTETYQGVSQEDFLDDIRFILGGKKYTRWDGDKRLTDLKIGDCATLHEVRAFGASQCAFPIGKERQNFLKLQSENHDQAMLLFNCNLPPAESKDMGE
jgi:hypothetical protein